jgi:hypothetical protein
MRRDAAQATGAIMRKQPNETRAALRIILWAIGLGFGGFLLGFAGPIILAPHNPQGPLLGLFITGPGGFVVGLVIGFVRYFKWRKRADDLHHCKNCGYPIGTSDRCSECGTTLPRRLVKSATKGTAA